MPLAEVPVEDFETAVRVNLLGTFYSMKYEIPAMLAGGGGAIVNMSSTAGLVGVKGIGGYVASKHGIVGYNQNCSAGLCRAKYPGKCRHPRADPHKPA